MAGWSRGSSGEDSLGNRGSGEGLGWAAEVMKARNILLDKLESGE